MLWLRARTSAAHQSYFNLTFQVICSVLFKWYRSVERCLNLPALARMVD